MDIPKDKDDMMSMLEGYFLDRIMVCDCENRFKKENIIEIGELMDAIRENLK